MTLRESIQTVTLQEIALHVLAFISGFSGAYQLNRTATWFELAMGGVYGFVVAATMYSVTNPRLHPKSPEAILEYVKTSPDLAPEVKAAVAPVLAVEIMARWNASQAYASIKEPTQQETKDRIADLQKQIGPKGP